MNQLFVNLKKDERTGEMVIERNKVNTQVKHTATGLMVLKQSDLPQKEARYATSIIDSSTISWSPIWVLAESMDFRGVLAGLYSEVCLIRDSQDSEARALTRALSWAEQVKT